jgi:hypothetical protein
VALLDLKRDATVGELKVFACVLFPIFAAIAGFLLIWNSGAWLAAEILWGVAAALAVVGFVAPRAVKPVFLLWMWAAFPIGWVVGHTLMGAIFYLVFTPVGWLLRFASHDAMTRRFDPQAESYWIPRKQVTDMERYFRQF